MPSRSEERGRTQEGDSASRLPGGGCRGAQGGRGRADASTEGPEPMGAWRDARHPRSLGVTTRPQRDVTLRAPGWPAFRKRKEEARQAAQRRRGCEQAGPCSPGRSWGSCGAAAPSGQLSARCNVSEGPPRAPALRLPAARPGEADVCAKRSSAWFTAARAGGEPNAATHTTDCHPAATGRSGDHAARPPSSGVSGCGRLETRAAWRLAGPGAAGRAGAVGAAGRGSSLGARDYLKIRPW